MTDVDKITVLADRLRAMDPPYPADRFSGRGIVVAAGGAPLFTNAYVLISILRRTLGCRLPIEVWHFGADEMSPAMAALLDELRVDVIDALPRLAAEGVDISDGWQLKSFCLNYSRFAEVLMLDADQVPARDPSELFDWPEYRAAGAVFWPDILEIRSDNPIWSAMGLTPGAREISFESGQVLVDKRRHWRTLSIALELNAASELIYDYVYGDKDTFLLAFRLAGASCALVPHLPFRGDKCLFQRDFEGTVIFQHKTTGKWEYASDDQPGENAQLFAESLAALATLRQRWNGRVFHAPDRLPEARNAEAELIARRHFRLDIAADGYGHLPHLELLRFGEIGEGRGAFRQNWWCESREDGLHLVIRDPDRITYDLARQDDGTWLGIRLFHNSALVTLMPVVDEGPEREPAPGLADTLLRAIGYPNHSASDWARFHDAATLIAQVEPGFLTRLAELAADATHPDLGNLVAGLVPPSRRHTRSTGNVLQRHYRSTLDFDG